MHYFPLTLATDVLYGGLTSTYNINTINSLQKKCFKITADIFCQSNQLFIDLKLLKVNEIISPHDSGPRGKIEAKLNEAIDNNNSYANTLKKNLENTNLVNIIKDTKNDDLIQKIECELRSIQPYYIWNQ